MERWIRTCRTELLDRTLVLNQAHLLQALREYEDFYNRHRPTVPYTPPPRRNTSATDRQTRTRTPRHPTTRSTRRHPPRIPPRCLTSTDRLFGTHKVKL
ncbi:hypothetical protein [Kibdelosporangium banguiense]|uniref:hypothetical protein n=1 Tax=Kibdelosporangium banguiense TaxID=1365924 RepID=UPI001FD8BCBF|nr:hypothetical protein [Kibdelosporangium banguiense]